MDKDPNKQILENLAGPISDKPAPGGEDPLMNNIDQLSTIEPKKKFPILALVIGGFAVIAIISLSAGLFIFFNRSSNEQDQDQKDNNAVDENDQNVINFDAYKFAEYNLEPVDIEPKVEKYDVRSDLSDVYYLKKDGENPDYARLDEELSTNQKQALAEDLFIITEGNYKEFFSLYEQNRYSFVPNFITTDSILHSYHLIFASTLKNLEKNYLSTELDDLSKEMVIKSLEDYNSSDNQDIKTAAKRNVAFFTVGAKLLDPSFQIPDLVKSEVEKELSMINAQEGIAVSEVMSIGYEDVNPYSNLEEDYSQYIARGHYTQNEELENYFRSMMWYGRLTFLAKDQNSTISALLITENLSDDSTFEKWEGIFSPINFFVGKSDDLTYIEYNKILSEYENPVVSLTEEELNEIFDKISNLEAPKINSIPIYDDQDRDSEIKGFRFLGQRFTIDAQIFQELVYRSVEETSNNERKMLPSFIEIPAVMGDEVALDIIRSNTNYFEFPNYESQLTKLQESIDSLDEKKWTQNLYWSWLYSLNSFVGETDDGYPTFMQSEKWQKKELNTYAGSWTELKHDTILYSKQVYAEMGAGPSPEIDDRGYVEPNLELWNKVAALVDMTREGLSQRGIITETQYEEGDFYSCQILEDYKERIDCTLADMTDIVDKLQTITKKQLQNEELSEEEHDFIRYFGGRLENLFMATLEPNSDSFSALDDNPIMLVADVATDPNGVVLEQGIGYVNNIYVIVPVGDGVRIAKGGVYSQYEFEWPINDRLTNEKWRELLESGNTPEMKEWQRNLIAE